MTNETVERRLLLRGAGLAGAAVLGSTAIAAGADAHDRDDDRDRHDHDDDRSKVVGSWLITHQDDPGGNPTKVTGVASFAEGGVLANQDINPIAPTGLGAWEGHGDNRFTGNFWAGAPGGGPEEPAVTLNVMIRGRVRGDMISGTYRFTVFAADGGDELASGTGTFEGERIEA
jgi:hypothetical protein